MPAASDICTLVQQSLTEVAGCNLPILGRQRVGFLDGMTGPENTSGYEQIRTDEGDGKNKKVILRYFQPLDDADLVDEKTDVCTPDIEPVPLEVEAEVTSDLWSKSLIFSKATMRNFCESPQEWQAKVIGSALDTYMVGLNKRLIAQYLTKYGVFPDATVAPKQISLINQTGTGAHQADYWGEATMLADFKEMSGCQGPIVVGAGVLDKYASMKGIGCCNAYGQEINNIGNFFYNYDNFVDAQAGIANAILAWHPGSFQLMQHNDNKGEFADDTSPHSAETILIDPITGIELDLEVNYDRCTKNWVIAFGTKYDLFSLPTDIYKATDDRFGTNGGLYYQGIIS